MRFATYTHSDKQMVYSGTNLAAYTATSPSHTFAGATLVVDGGSPATPSVVFTVPGAVVASAAGQVVSITFTLFNSSSFFLSARNSSTIVSQVVDASVSVLGGPQLHALPYPAAFSLRYTPPPEGLGSRALRCVYWDDTAASWLTDGVTLVTSENGTASCLTGHLTNFAILLVTIEILTMQHFHF